MVRITRHGRSFCVDGLLSRDNAHKLASFLNSLPEDDYGHFLLTAEVDEASLGDKKFVHKHPLSRERIRLFVENLKRQVVITDVNRTEVYYFIEFDVQVRRNNKYDAYNGEIIWTDE